jgi:uncharacterized protein YdhG (YjbR/CyaY superfamily)
MNNKDIKTVDEYMAQFVPETQVEMQKVRQTIIKAAPNAQEVISYKMPAYKFNGMLVYFAAYKNHIGFYPGADAIKLFNNEIIAYKWAKGSVQFPLNKPMPLALITKIVKYRVDVNLNKIKK